MKAFCTLQVSSVCKYLSWITIDHGLSMHYIFKNETYETYTKYVCFMICGTVHEYMLQNVLLLLFRRLRWSEDAAVTLEILVMRAPASIPDMTRGCHRPHNAHNVMITRIVHKDAPCVRHVGKSRNEKNAVGCNSNRHSISNNHKVYRIKFNWYNAVSEKCEFCSQLSSTRWSPNVSVMPQSAVNCVTIRQRESIPQCQWRQWSFNQMEKNADQRGWIQAIVC